jgi:hypothetical protein
VYKVKVRRKEIERRLVEFSGNVIIEANTPGQAKEAVQRLNANTNELLSEIEWKREGYEDLASEVSQNKPVICGVKEDELTEPEDASYIAENLLEEYGPVK